MTLRASLSRPFRPIEMGADTLAFFQLPALAEDLKCQDEYASSGVSAITLARDGHVTLVLVALRKGSLMREHRAPSAAVVVVISGRVRFVAGDAAHTDLVPGSLAAFSADVFHAVEALEDAAYLVIIGGRERPLERAPAQNPEGGARGRRRNESATRRPTRPLATPAR